MLMKHRMVFLKGALCALVASFSCLSQAATIIKLNLGGVGPDLQMNAGGTLSTDTDNDPTTPGDQNTAIEYTGFLDPLFADVSGSPPASFSLSGLQADPAGAAFSLGLVIQGFHGGNFNLYGSNNTLLLSGTVATATLAGVTTPPGTGSLFTTTLGAITGGTLQPLIVPGTVSVSMNLATVNGGNGFSTVTGPGGILVLQPFKADASALISGAPSPNVPEPASMTFVLAAVVLGGACGRRRLR
ncbi:MAG TPA: hypothetical protein VH107_17825 [Lacipirellulaceae bacterium]|jgi:hypothetical protein|nr:hypothetical protein [Lacipirellulaceae bacterium]